MAVVSLSAGLLWKYSRCHKPHDLWHLPFCFNTEHRRFSVWDCENNEAQNVLQKESQKGCHIYDLGGFLSPDAGDLLGLEVYFKRRRRLPNDPYRTQIELMGQYLLTDETVALSSI